LVKENEDMGLMGKIHQLITDALTIWREAGVNRPFTRRGMTEDELLNGYRFSQKDGGKEGKTSSRSSEPKKPSGD
jgi:hypothetical protein